jgi:hypothetical protein
MASRKPQRIHDQAKIQAEGRNPLNRPKDQQSQISPAIGADIVQTSRGNQYQARPHHRNATDTCGSYNGVSRHRD